MNRGDACSRTGFAAIAHALNLTVGLVRRIQIDAEMRQRSCGEQGDQTGQHLDQGLHPLIVPEIGRFHNVTMRARVLIDRLARKMERSAPAGV